MPGEDVGEAPGPRLQAPVCPRLSKMKQSKNGGRRFIGCYYCIIMPCMRTVYFTAKASWKESSVAISGEHAGAWRADLGEPPQASCHLDPNRRSGAHIQALLASEGLYVRVLRENHDYDSYLTFGYFGPLEFGRTKEESESQLCAVCLP